MKAASKIEEVRAKEGVTYSEARDIVFSQAEHPPLPAHSKTTVQAGTQDAVRPKEKLTHKYQDDAIPQASATTKSSYRDVVAVQSLNVTKSDVNSKTCGGCSYCGCGPRKDSIGPEFLMQLKNCFLEILQSNIFQENSGSRSLLVESAIRKSFNSPGQKADLTNGSHAVLAQSSGVSKRPPIIRMEESDINEESANEEDVLSCNEASQPTEAPWKTVDKERVKL
jgi:hypothetical protein